MRYKTCDIIMLLKDEHSKVELVWQTYFFKTTTVMIRWKAPIKSKRDIYLCYIKWLNGHRYADKRANSYWRFLHVFPRNSSRFYNVGRQAKSSDDLCGSSMAKWLERLCLYLGVVSSSPRLYIFLIKLLFFIYFLAFPFYFSQFWSKTMCEYI